ncbi:MAG: hypothetical protein KKA19_09140 [Candidatus Margulisbacteria bacterium]|nr:hypothetical protein [Candidatus Margulisiibacteriota bacterium]
MLTKIQAQNSRIIIRSMNSLEEVERFIASSQKKLEMQDIVKILPKKCFLDKNKLVLILVNLQKKYPQKIIDRRVASQSFRDFYPYFYKVFFKHKIDKDYGEVEVEINPFLTAVLVIDAKGDGEGKLFSLFIQHLFQMWPEKIQEVPKGLNIKDEKFYIELIKCYKPIYIKPISDFLRKKTVLQSIGPEESYKLIENEIKKNIKEPVAIYNDKNCKIIHKQIVQILSVYYEGKFPLITNEDQIILVNEEKKYVLSSMETKELIKEAIKIWLYFKWYQGTDPFQFQGRIDYIVENITRTFNFANLNSEESRAIGMILALFMCTYLSRQARSSINNFIGSTTEEIRKSYKFWERFISTIKT